VIIRLHVPACPSSCRAASPYPTPAPAALFGITFCSGSPGFDALALWWPMHSACLPTPPQAADRPPIQPEVTALHQLFDENLDQFFEHREQQGRPLPGYIRRAFQKFKECGDPRFGYAAIACFNCGELQSVPLSCKQRAWCPRCIVRQMIERGEFISNRIIGDTPVRHFVFGFPPPLRYALAYNHKLLAKLVSVVVEAILTFLRKKAKKAFGLRYVKDAFPGAVSSIHRCSSDLSLHVHIHIIVTEGVFVRGEPGGSVSFRDLPPLTQDEVAQIAWNVCSRTTDIMRDGGQWRDIQSDSDDSSISAPASNPTPVRQIRGILSLGQNSREREITFVGRAAGHTQDEQGGYGFDLHAGRVVARGDHEGLKKLAQYMSHAPFSDQQLSLTPDGRVMLKPDPHRRKGTKTVVFDKFEFMNKLVTLVPYPRSRTIRFHGVYAPNATLRDEVLPKPKVTVPTSPNQSSAPSHPSHRMSWIEMIKRNGGPDLTLCPHCFEPTVVIIRRIRPSARKKPIHGAGLAGDSHDPPPTHAPDNRASVQ